MAGMNASPMLGEKSLKKRWLESTAAAGTDAARTILPQPAPPLYLRSFGVLALRCSAGHLPMRTLPQQKNRPKGGGRRWWLGWCVLVGLGTALLLAHGCHLEEHDDEPMLVPRCCGSDQRPELP